MSMFCFQCQETAKNEGCTVRGVCGKQEDTSDFQDLLIYNLKGIAYYGDKLVAEGETDRAAGLFLAKGLFATITNANFDNEAIEALIREAFCVREGVRKRLQELYKENHGTDFSETAPDCATWYSDFATEWQEKAKTVGVLSTENEDVRSLRELLIIGLKGLCAYAEHAEILGFEKDEIYAFIMEALVSTTLDLSVDEMVAMVMKCGDFSVQTMALLDEANTTTYGNPEITTVNIGAGDKPGILISGHDLRDLKDLLEQTKGTGVDVYTHGEMLPAHYYPELKKYDNLVANYGGAWWQQNQEFDSFNGPILMTTNCITPVREDYKDRIYTTGMTGWPGVKHIADRVDGHPKDFSEIIEQAKTCKPPTEIESGSIVGGFAHNQVLALADKVVEAVKSGAIKRFVVMGGCDGRQKGRSYFTEVAEELPKDTIILTAGCAKYRYNKLDLGDIGGIPRVLDAGQCNDSYSLAVIALKLKEVFELEDINDLPISFDIAWYEQKAVCVLLALLFLGVKGIRLGPTLPAFLSPNVTKVLVDNFDIKPTGEVKADVEAMMAGK